MARHHVAPLIMLSLAFVISGCGQRTDNNPSAATTEDTQGDAASSEAIARAAAEAAVVEYQTDNGLRHPDSDYSESSDEPASSGPQLGDRRIVERDWGNGPYGISCRAYQMVQIDQQGGQAPQWVSFGHRNRNVEVRDCQGAINLQEYLDTRRPEELGTVADMAALVRERQNEPSHPNHRAHACGDDGLVYDVFPSGRAVLHTQTLMHPNRRCRIVRDRRFYATFSLDALLSVRDE